jgi:hypothetical protein
MLVDAGDSPLLLAHPARIAGRKAAKEYFNVNARMFRRPDARDRRRVILLHEGRRQSHADMTKISCGPQQLSLLRYAGT